MYPLQRLWHLPADMWNKLPLRIDLPIPFLQIDIVFVNDPGQIKILREDVDCGRMHQVPSEQQPGWAQYFFKGTRFYDTAHDAWFVAMEGQGTSDYEQRRECIAACLKDEWYTSDDVSKVAELLKSGASDEVLAETMVPIINSRFLQGHKPIPSNIVQDAKAMLNSPANILKPGVYGKAVAAGKSVIEFCAASGPIKGLKEVDVAHNIGAAANEVVKALTILRDNAACEDLNELFTSSENVPTPAVPRIALAASKFGGLLSYPAKPGKTVFFFNISRAAGKERSLFWTFGTGVPERSCPFRPFMMSFLKDVQKKLSS